MRSSARCRRVWCCCRAGSAGRAGAAATPHPPAPRRGSHTTGRDSGPGYLGKVADPLGRLVLRPRVLKRRDELLDESRRRVDPGDDGTGDVALLDLVLDPGERQGELVAGEADVGEVGVAACNVRRVEMDVQPALTGLRLIGCVLFGFLVHAGILEACRPPSDSVKCSGCSGASPSRSSGAPSAFTRRWTSRGFRPFIARS